MPWGNNGNEPDYLGAFISLIVAISIGVIALASLVALVLA